MDAFFAGDITELDVITVLPFNNKVVLVKMKGKDIRDMLQYSVHRHNDWDGGGRFLQLSGQFSPTHNIVAKKNTCLVIILTTHQIVIFKESC